MVQILIRGGDAEAATAGMADGLREIFGIAPGRSSLVPGENRRGLVELATLILAIPPAATAMIDLAARLKLVQRIERLIAHAETQRAATGATLLIDPGDGKPIRLERASRDRIMSALGEVEARLKAKRDERG